MATHQSKSVLRRSIGRIRRILRRWVPRHNHIFRHEGPFPPERHPQAEFSVCDSADLLSPSLMAQLKATGTERMLETDLVELRSGSRLWYGLVDGRLAVVLFTRRGHQFRNWFTPLQPSDMVIFRVRTYPEFRGRGLAPSLMRYAMHESLQNGDCSFIDCGTDNQPSIRSIEKAGFRKIATMKPITREFALGWND